MTIELLDETAPNSVSFTMSWLLPICLTPRHLGMKRLENSPLPFRMVGLIHEVDDQNEGLSIATVSVHTMAKAANGVDADTLAIREGDITHRRMLALARNPLSNVVMPDGSIANLEYLNTSEKPALRDYRDQQISRVKAVYELGLSYVAV